VIEFTVYGTPAPAGSKRGFKLKNSNRVVVTDASKRSKPWQGQVAQRAAEAMAGRQLLDGALEVDVTFYKRRPKGHFGTRGLRPSAPAFPAVKPDATKLWRCVEDALTGIVYRDDALIVTQHVRKRYGEPERVEISVREQQGAQISTEKVA